MSEEKATEKEVEKTENTTDQEVGKTEDNSIPYSRFKEVNEAKKTLEKQLADIEAKIKAESEKKLEEEGKFKELNEKLAKERDVYKVQAEQWNQYQEVRRKALIEKIPEEDREIYDELSLSKLEKAVEKFNKNVKVNVASPGGVGKYKTYADIATAFNRGELSREQYKEERKKFGR